MSRYELTCQWGSKRVNDVHKCFSVRIHCVGNQRVIWRRSRVGKSHAGIDPQDATPTKPLKVLHVSYAEGPGCFETLRVYPLAQNFATGGWRMLILSIIGSRVPIKKGEAVQNPDGFTFLKLLNAIIQSSVFKFLHFFLEGLLEFFVVVVDAQPFVLAQSLVHFSEQLLTT